MASQEGSLETGSQLQTPPPPPPLPKLDTHSHPDSTTKESFSRGRSFIITKTCTMQKQILAVQCVSDPETLPIADHYPNIFWLSFIRESKQSEEIP